MPQISLYVDSETMSGLREDAKRDGVSISKYVGNLIKNKPENGGYPEGFFALYGRWTDDLLSQRDAAPGEPAGSLYR